jgi:hypothetical protein
MSDVKLAALIWGGIAGALFLALGLAHSTWYLRARLYLGWEGRLELVEAWCPGAAFVPETDLPGSLHALDSRETEWCRASELYVAIESTGSALVYRVFVVDGDESELIAKLERITG